MTNLVIYPHVKYILKEITFISARNIYSTRSILSTRDDRSIKTDRSEQQT